MKKKILKRDAGARGEAHAKMLAGRNAIDDITGLELGKDSMLTRFETENYEEPAALSPSETVGIVSDFNQMLDVLADRYGVKRARKFGNLVRILSSIKESYSQIFMHGSFVRFMV